MAAEIGRICFKLAGRESGKRCVIVDMIDDNFVLINGPQVKRRRCNLKHLELSDQKIEISKGSSTEEVEKALKKASSGEQQKNQGSDKKASQ